MDVVNERCCGLDVHKQTVVACVIVPGNGRQPHKEVRTFHVRLSPPMMAPMPSSLPKSPTATVGTPAPMTAR